MPERASRARRRVRRSRASPIASNCADPCHAGEVDRVAEHHRSHVEAAEGDRRRAEAEPAVVVAIDHRVFGVVRDHPEQIDRTAATSRAAARRRSTARKAIGMPNENAMPEKRLRQREEALEERIDDRDGERRQRQQDRRLVGRQHEQERAERQHCRDRERFPRRDLAGRERPLRRALHVRHRTRDRPSR